MSRSRIRKLKIINYYNAFFTVLIIASEDYGKIFPQERIIALGEQTSVVCLSFTTPLWTKLNKRISSFRHSDSNNKIKISNAHDYDAGVYTCTGTTQDGKQFITDAIIHVAGIIYAL